MKRQIRVGLDQFLVGNDRNERKDGGDPQHIQQRLEKDQREKTAAVSYPCGSANV